MKEYIERQMLLKRIKELSTWWANAIDYYDVVNLIKNMPTADVETVKYGQWNWNEDDYGYECSTCHYFWDYNGSYEVFDKQSANYCPNCGSKMLY